MRTTLLSLFPARPQRLAAWAGVAAFAGGLAHVGLALLPDAAWSGPTGLRKPAVFGLSIGVTLWSLAWLTGRLNLRPWLQRLALGAMSATLLLELLVIALQRARGVPSHFNLGTPLDAALWTLMGASIAVFAFLAFVLAVLAWKHLPVPPALAAALRASLLIFALSQLSGQFLAVHGTGTVFVEGRYRAENLAHASTFGAAGNLKLPHALSLHAIQILPLLGFLLTRVGAAGRRGATWVWTSAAGFFGVFALAQSQALAGRAPADLDTGTALLLAVSLTAFLVPWLFAAVTALPHCRRGRANAKVTAHA